MSHNWRSVRLPRGIRAHSIDAKSALRRESDGSGDSCVCGAGRDRCIERRVLHSRVAGDPHRPGDHVAFGVISLIVRR